MKSWWNPSTWFTLIFWDLLAGYGRNPFRSFGLGLFIVLGASLLYDPRYLKMDFINKWNLDFDLKLREAFKSGLAFKKRTYIMNSCKLFFLRFMVSFDKFIPAINLGLAE